MEKNTKTQREMFTQLLNNYALTDEEVAFITGRIAQLDKKAYTSKSAEKQIENEKIANSVLDYLATVNGSTTISAMARHFDLSTKKLTPIVNKLAERGKVKTEMFKRVNYYSLG